MRFATFIIAFYFLFAQTQAYAINLNKGNIVNATMRNGGSLLVKTGKGALVLAGGGGVGYAIRTAIDLCKNNKKFCSELIGESIEELLEDEQTLCIYAYEYKGGYYSVSEYLEKFSEEFDVTANTRYRLKPHADVHDRLVQFGQKAVNDYEQLDNNDYNDWHFVTSVNIFYEIHIFNNGQKGNVLTHQSTSSSLYVKCSEEPTESEKIDALVQRLTDKQLTTIVNNYYNNGNGIDVDEFCKRDDVICKDQGEGDEGDDYPRWEKINGRRCLVNKDREIIRCEDEPSKADNDNNKGEKLFCDTTDFTKKVCDFIDWMQDDDTRHDDTKVQVQDLAKDKAIDKDRINFSASCPADTTFTMSFAGATVNPTISYKNFCEAMIKLKPFIIGLSSISGVLIIAGGRRGI